MKQQATLSTLFGLVALGAATVLAPLTSFDAKADDHEKHGKDKVEVEGTVSQVSGTCPNLRFTVGDTQVVAQEKTRYDDGSCDDVTSGRRVEVKGKLGEDGKLSAWKVDLDD